MRGAHLKCWSCRHYQRLAEGPHAWRHVCARGVAACPLIGQACPQYEYEPGSDHAETADG